MADLWSQVSTIVIANAVVITTISGFYGIFWKEWITSNLEKRNFLFEERQKREAEFYTELWPAVCRAISICSQVDATINPQVLDPQPDRRDEMAENVVDSMKMLLGRMEDIRPFLPIDFIKSTEEFGDLLARKWTSIIMPTTNQVIGQEGPTDEELAKAAARIENVIRQRLGTS